MEEDLNPGDLETSHIEDALRPGDDLETAEDLETWPRLGLGRSCSKSGFRSKKERTAVRRGLVCVDEGGVGRGLV